MSLFLFKLFKHLDLQGEHSQVSKLVVQDHQVFASQTAEQVPFL